MDSGPCGGIQSVMTWCLCLHDGLFLRVMHVAHSTMRKVSYRFLVDFSYSVYIFSFSFSFLLFSRPGEGDDVYKSRNIGKLTTHSM